MTELTTPGRVPVATGAAAPAVRARRAPLVVGSLLVGLLISVLWSAALVDSTIGGGMANTLVGQDARQAAIAGLSFGLLYAFAAGIGGTFTACNVAAFSALAPMMSGQGSGPRRWRVVLAPLGWMALGLIPVAALYGAAGAALGDRIPQLSRAVIGPHQFPERLLQSMVVYGILGLAFIYLGLAAVDLVPDPMARLARAWAPAPMVVMGVLIALFLVGRPYPLFYKTFSYAAGSGGAWFGALAFVLVAIGNVLVLALLFGLLALPGHGALPRWLAARPAAVARFTAASMLIAGSFMLVYWTVRLPARFDYGWFPVMPWH